MLLVVENNIEIILFLNRIKSSKTFLFSLLQNNMERRKAVVFTKTGYKRDGLTPVATISFSENSGLSFGIEWQETEPSLVTFFVNHKNLDTGEQRERSLTDVLTLIYNIALGQRTSTPKYLSQFIDRPEKTFFNDSAHVTLLPEQFSVTNISAMVNYFVISSSDPTKGIIFPIWEALMCYTANIALMLDHALNDGNGECIERNSDGKKNNIAYIDIDDEQRTRLRNELPDIEAIEELIFGCYVCCCWRDHSVVGKDIGSVKIRTLLNKYSETMMSVAIDDPGMAFSTDNIETLRRASHAIKEVWLVDEKGEKIFNLLAVSDDAE